MSLFRRARVIHEKPRPAGVTAAGASALAFGLLVLLFSSPSLVALVRDRDFALLPLLPSAVGALLLVAGAGLLRRSKAGLFLVLGLAVAGAAESGAGLLLRLDLAVLGGNSAWGWLLGLWYCLLLFLYLRQKRVVESF